MDKLKYNISILNQYLINKGFYEKDSELLSIMNKILNNKNLKDTSNNVK